MAKKIKMEAKGNVVEFGFDHALALLRLQESQGNSDWKIATKQYEFLNNEIVRKRSNKADKKEAE